MKPNIKDVAKHANVSIATVSNVLNNSRCVSAKTKSRVLNSIKELGYVPDIMARNFKKGHYNLIGIIIPDISNYFWAIIIEEVEKVLATYGYHLIVVNTNETADREIDNLSLLSSGMVDGIIIGSTLESCSSISKIMPPKFPLLFIDRTPDDCFYDSITISNYYSIYNGVSHLISKGHRKIGYITGLKHLSTTKERLQGYYDAMYHYGLEVPSVYVQTANSMSMSALLPMHNLIDAGCTALIISNNVMADDVISYLNNNPSLSNKIIDVIGYKEGTKSIIYHPPFALIDQPAAHMGELAAKQIITRINKPNSNIINTTLSSNITFYKNSNSY